MLSLLRREAISDFSQASDLLRSHGFSNEASCLTGAGADVARQMVENELVVTAAHPSYPRAWVERLGAGSPCALYARGTLELLGAEPLGIVGSRQPPPRSVRAAIQTAECAAELGMPVVSGGAPGVDRAVSYASQIVEIWPCGLGMRWGAKCHNADAFLHLSMWPPRELFSAAAAMERNALIYALACAAFVGHARFRQGGSWHGATDALRRRLTRILVTAAPWPRQDLPAQRALIGLGAFQLESITPEAVKTAMEATPMQPWLPAMGADPTVSGALASY